MKINLLCKLISLYNGLQQFYIESSLGELDNLTPHPALVAFIDSYSKLNSLISYWEANGLPACREVRVSK